jgi:predicted TIM-barrel fold metal-dependent hydrolase
LPGLKIRESFVNVVYSRRWIEAAGPDPRLPQGTLAELERALGEAGIVYAIVDQNEQTAFFGQLNAALPANKLR